MSLKKFTVMVELRGKALERARRIGEPETRTHFIKAQSADSARAQAKRRMILDRGDFEIIATRNGWYRAVP